MQNEGHRQRQIFGQPKGCAESGLGAITGRAGTHVRYHDDLRGLIIDYEKVRNMPKPEKSPDSIFPDSDQAYEYRHRPKHHAPALDLPWAAKHIGPRKENGGPACLRDDESLN